MPGDEELMLVHRAVEMEVKETEADETKSFTFDQIKKLLKD